MKIESIDLKFPEGANVILGQSHFIKTVEDLYEVMMSSVPNARFGIAFSEASGERLVRLIGNDRELKEAAAENLSRIKAGHCFLIIMEECFPINFLPAIKAVPEVCRIFCATANPVSVLVARNEGGDGGILGVIDGKAPVGIEGDDGISWRHDFLRKIGYKK